MQSKFKRILGLLRKEGGSRISRESMPNSFFLNDLLWGGDAASESTAVSRGFIVEPGERDSMDEDSQHDLIDRLRVMLGILGAEYSIQVRLLVCSDYSDVLNQQQKDTDAIADKHRHRWQVWNRTERHARYTEAMNAGKLRREILTVFFTRVIDASPSFSVSEESLAKHFQTLAARESLAFEKIQGDALNVIFPDCRIRAMTDEDHFRHVYRFLNPNIGASVPDWVMDGYDDSLSLQENCLFGDIVQPNTPGVSFQLDAYEHAILVMRTLPKRSGPSMISRLTDLGFTDFELVVNVYPQRTAKVVEEVEKAANHLAGEVRTQPKKTHSLATQLDMAKERIADLERGNVLPMNVFLALRLWHKDASTLVSRASIAKNAFISMAGATAHYCSNAETARQIWFNCWPGWTFSSYRGFDLACDDHTAAELLPWSASFTGRLDGAEALYDSARGGLVGVSTQVGGVPQAALIFGQVGSGKSLWLTDLLAQIGHLFKYVLIVEEGLSHAVTAATLGGSPIVLSPNGSVTINYLGCDGIPLTNEQLGGAVALCLQMLRENSATADPSRVSVLQGILTQHINLLYDAAWEEWARLNPLRALEIADRAYWIEAHRATLPDHSNSFLEAWADLRDVETGPVDAGEVAKFATHPATRSIVRNLGLSYVPPDQMPTHSQLVELLTLTPLGGYDDNPEAVAIGDRLLVWKASGPYGKIFDGVSTDSLNSSITHFELGLIPDSMEELRSACHFLVLNFARQRVVKQRRADRKILVFEEGARLLQVPGGERVLKEFYGQMRKFGCTVITVFQQISAFKECSPAARAAVIDNAKLIIVSAQPSPAAVKEIGDALELTDATRQTIQRFPLPEHQSSGRKFSSFTMICPDPRRKIVGTFRNVAAPEVIYAGSSDNEIFDERQKALKQYEDVVEGILELSRK